MLGISEWPTFEWKIPLLGGAFFFGFRAHDSVEAIMDQMIRNAEARIALEKQKRQARNVTVTPARSATPRAKRVTQKTLRNTSGGVSKVCPVCRDTFQTHRANAVTCSGKCRTKLSRMNRGK